MQNLNEGLLFDPALSAEIKDRFYYVDADPEFGQRLFFENSGGSLRLKASVEAQAKYQAFPDCPERLHDRSRALKKVQLHGIDDIMHIVFGASGGALISEMTASQAMFQIVGAILENCPGKSAVTSVLEHPSAYDAVKYYCDKTGKEFRVAQANPKTGGIDVEEIRRVVSPDTCLLSIMYASNITGSIMDMAGIVKAAREINPDIDPALEAIIMKAIAKNPADRFATAKDMRLALNDYLAGRPVNLGEGFTSAETVVMGGVVPPVGVADGTAVMPAMGGVSPASPTAAQRSYNANNTSGKKNNKKTIAIVIGIIAALAVVGGIAFALMSGSGNDKDKVAVPSVVGQTVDQATAAIEGAGFELGKVEESFDDKVESGKVISQDPKGDSKQAKGTKINLTVSKGVQEITVPDLTGMTADQAQKALTASGLKYAKGAAEYSDTVEKDHVARQDIAAGENVAKDTVVTYYLSLGSEGIEVPNVVGMSRGNAVTTLNNAGLIVDTDNYTYEASDQPEGTVLAQTPAAGSKLQKDGLVALTLSKGPEKKTFSVAVNANGGGKISASASSVTEGDSVTITITPDSGYEVASASGLDDVPKSGGTFTISNVKANVNVNVTFQAVTPSPTPDPKPTDDTNKN